LFPLPPFFPPLLFFANEELLAWGWLGLALIVRLFNLLMVPGDT
jgi:hypothetical protein